MTRPLPDGPRGPAEPGTERLRRLAAGGPEPSTAELTARPAGHGGADEPRTGPLPAVDGEPAVVPAAAGTPPPPGDGPPATPAAAEPAPAGRAGRDLKAAIGVGLGLGAVILASLLIYRPAFLAVLTAAVLVAVVELSRALRAGGLRPPLVPVLIGALAMEVLAWTRGATGLSIAFLFTVLAVLLWRLAPGPAGYLRDTAAGALGALYVPLL